MFSFFILRALEFLNAACALAPRKCACVCGRRVVTGLGISERRPLPLRLLPESLPGEKMASANRTNDANQQWPVGHVWSTFVR